jgi:hypothetical protein
MRAWTHLFDAAVKSAERLPGESVTTHVGKCYECDEDMKKKREKDGSVWKPPK